MTRAAAGLQARFREATNPARLAELKARLAQNRRSRSLFDTALFTRRLEAAYSAMHARHQAGLAPDHIEVAG